MAETEQVISRLFAEYPDKLKIESAQLIDGGKATFRISQATLLGRLQKARKALEEAEDPRKFFEVFHVDTIGSLFIRANLDVFLRLAENISQQDYMNNLVQAQHVHFTMKLVGSDQYEFSFHISLLHDVAIETLYSYVGST